MERLRECISITRKNIRLVPEEEAKKLSESTGVKNPTSSEVISALYSLRENSRDKDLIDQVIGKLQREGLDTHTKKTWRIPVARFDNLNGNRRIYPRALYENMMNDPEKKDQWFRNIGLVDHPIEDDDPGSLKNAGIVWLDMDIDDTNKMIWGIGRFIGPLGQMCEEMIEAGGKCGVSQSGFGDVDKYTNVVDPNTYIPERLGDLVLNPSQKVFGTIECPHTPDEFLNDVHQAQTIEFQKQKTQEQLSMISKRIKEADQGQVDPNQTPNGGTVPTPVAPAVPAAPAAPKPAVPAPAAQPAGQIQQPTKSFDAANPQPVQEKKERRMGTLTKIEEKAFRKYVDAFMADAANIENPMKRLDECIDILNCFEEGNCPDLRESLEKQIISEKKKLESLVESVISTQKDLGMDIDSLKEAAYRNTAQGLLLNEQVTDYEKLCEGLSKRNKELRADNTKLTKKLEKFTKLSEQKIEGSNKTIVSSSKEIKALKEELSKAEGKNDLLMEKISKLALSNKHFEKENGILATKLKESASLIMKGRKLRESKDDNVQSLKEENAKLRKVIESQKAKIAEISDQYDAQAYRFDTLHETFEAYKQEVQDKFNPVQHIMPRAEQRIGKYLNLKENDGVEIENYWSDLLSKYKEAITPYEEEIRGAKTLREATTAFLKIRESIDNNFQLGSPVGDFAFRNREERAKLYEQMGQINPVEQYNNQDTDTKNALFLDQLHKSGLK